MVWVASNWIEDTALQQFLFSSLYSFDSNFSGIFWFAKLRIIVLKEFVSVFNKETGKRHFLAFPGNGYKKEKNCFINNKNLVDSNYHSKNSVDWMSTE